MNAIADVLRKDSWFVPFGSISKFRKIPQGDDMFGPVDYADGHWIGCTTMQTRGEYRIANGKAEVAA